MKTSHYIQYPDACKFKECARQAKLKGTPWNCFMTINIETAGVAPENASLNLRQSLQRLKKYHERNNMPFSCGWVLENGSGKGAHAHLALHRPSALPMHAMKYWWAVLRCFQLPREKGVLQIKKFYSWQSYEENLSKVIAYMLEGIRPEAAALLNINYKNQGLVYGKRIGWSNDSKGGRVKSLQHHS